MGSKTVFRVILATFGLIAFGWHWAGTVEADWGAATLVAAALPAALSRRAGGAAPRKALSAASAAAALAFWVRFAAPGSGAPALEAAIVAVLALCALVGAVYLGQWGSDASEAAWARVLGALAAAGLLVSGLAWHAPESRSWSADAAFRCAAWWSALSASGGPWRWGGLIGVLGAMAAARGLRKAL